MRHLFVVSGRADYCHVVARVLESIGAVSKRRLFRFWHWPVEGTVEGKWDH